MSDPAAAVFPLPVPVPTVGAGARQKTYSLTVDTGSSLLELSCASPAARANCAGRRQGQNYVLQPSRVISNASACAATGVGCLAGGQCYYSQEVGGTQRTSGEAPGGGRGGQGAGRKQEGACGMLAESRLGRAPGMPTRPPALLATRPPVKCLTLPSSSRSHTCAFPPPPQLTGGAGFNGNKGLLVRDTVTLGASQPPLSFPGTFACSLAK